MHIFRDIIEEPAAHRQSEYQTRRKIRSFTRRQGRMTQGQQLAIEHYWEIYCLNPYQTLNSVSVFQREVPLFLEIGFGNGDCLAQMAAANPDNDYIGIEVHKPGVGHLIKRLEEQRLTNVKIYCHDAVEVFESCIADSSLCGIHLFFPDPWPKKKHHKRRIVQPDFVNLMVNKLKTGGYFHAATDWEHYASSMLAVLADCPRLTNQSPTLTYCDRPVYRPLTKFEQRGLKLGHGVWDLIFCKR